MKRSGTQRDSRLVELQGGSKLAGNRTLGTVLPKLTSMSVTLKVPIGLSSALFVVKASIHKWIPLPNLRAHRADSLR